MTVAIVNYNTTELTDAAIRSVRKHTPGCQVIVFDNSDKTPFVPSVPDVEVLDNTKGQIVDFDEMLSRYPNRETGERNRSNFGSAKHCMSVDKLMNMLPDGFVLMDSDVLVTRDISELVSNAVVCGTVGIKEGVQLFLPYICWLNVPLLQYHHIRYFNGDKMWALSDIYPNNRYDTGAWLYEEVNTKNLVYKSVDIMDYIVHFGHGSWYGRDASEWLNAYKFLYE